MAWRDVHGHGPDRSDHQLDAEKRGRKRECGNIDVVHHHDRKQEHEAAEHAGHDHVASRGEAIAGPAQNTIAGYAAERVADDAAKEDAGRIERRLFQVLMIVLVEEGWNPADEQPERPAIAEVD